jgi:uncharacterized membrane protein
MLTANRVLMQQAREALKGKWGLAVVGNLIYLALIAVVQFIPLVGQVANLIITGPLILPGALEKTGGRLIPDL